MVDVKEIEELDNATLVELYQLIVEHIHFLDRSVIEITVEEGESDE